MSIRSADIIFFDTETEVSNDLPVEVSAVHVKEGVVKDTFSTLIDIMRPISMKSTEIHNISNEMIKAARAPILPVAIRCFHLWIQQTGAAVISAHNYSGFDKRIVINAARVAGMEEHVKFFDPLQGLDTLTLCNKILKVSQDPEKLKLPEYVYNRKLGTLSSKFLGQAHANAHRAGADVAALSEIFYKLLDVCESKGIPKEKADFLTWLNGSYTFDRFETKQHFGQLISDVWKSDPGYCQFLLSSTKDENLKQSIMKYRNASNTKN